ncbi:MAG: hypothetical protein NVSMB19_25790 [Vulcanimicrobiaceae bacterium]
MSARRVAIITGASSGIGRALAERAVRSGWDVFAVGRRAVRLDALAGIVASATGRLTTLALDLREPGAAARIVRETLAAYGRIDVLVNNAGGVAVGPVAEQHDDALYEQMETHVIVPLALTREALPSLRASRGLVIYFGSGVARIPVGTLGAYPAAKAAVRSLARTARNELRPSGIAVTYVDPGAVATEFMTRAGFSGPPPALAASPYDVARTVFAAFATRPPVVNAVPWQTFFVALGAAFPKVTDYLLARAPGIVGGAALPPAVPEKPVLPAFDAATHVPEAVAVPEPPAPEPQARDGAPDFESALAPHASRMKKLNLRDSYVRALLVPGAELELGYVAMRWAGMPNKNERAITTEVLDALAEAGFLKRIEAERFLVLRGVDA